MQGTKRSFKNIAGLEKFVPASICLSSEMRLDQLLVFKKLAPSRSLALKLIKNQCVSIKLAGKWQIVTKASHQFEENCEIKITENNLQKYVSRAGLKLEAALERTQFSVKDVTALDVGQSTGGFTDCLLQQGAKKIIGVDVGHDQLHGNLRCDKRVYCMEGINARAMAANEELQGLVREVSLVVMDLSFISQKLVLPELPRLIVGPFTLISLVKPQFEVGKGGIGKGGLVKNTHLYGEVEQGIRAALSDLNLRVLDYFESRIEGGDGNKEFFVYAKML